MVAVLSGNTTFTFLRSWGWHALSLRPFLRHHCFLMKRWRRCVGMVFLDLDYRFWICTIRYIFEGETGQTESWFASRRRMFACFKGGV